MWPASPVFEVELSTSSWRNHLFQQMGGLALPASCQGAHGRGRVHPMSCWDPLWAGVELMGRRILVPEGRSGRVGCSVVVWEGQRWEVGGACIPVLATDSMVTGPKKLNLPHGTERGFEMNLTARLEEASL